MAATKKERPPTHIIDQPGDRRSRCGVKDPIPVVWAPHVHAHVERWGLVVCEECAAKEPE